MADTISSFVRLVKLDIILNYIATSPEGRGFTAFFGKVRFARYSSRRKQIPERDIANERSIPQNAGGIGPRCAPGGQQTG